MTIGYSLYILSVHLTPWIMAEFVSGRYSFTSCCSTSQLWELWNGSQFPMLNIGNWGTTRWDGWFLSPLRQNRQKWPTHCQLRVFYQTFSCKGRGPRTTSKIAFIGLSSLFYEDIGIQLLHTMHRKQHFTQEKFWVPNSAYRGELTR